MTASESPAGAQLRVQGLVLNHAVLPSQQLVASGLASPAPLAFNLSVSGNSSLLLDGCTVVTGCSNLGQFRLWVGSLSAADTADVQVRRGGQVCSAGGNLVGCSNLGQFRLWVGTLSTSDTADVQVRRGAGV